MVAIKNGMVVEPNIHDAQVMGIVLDKKGRALVPLEDVDGRALCIVMDGVVRLKTDDFRQDNTLLSLSVSSGESLDISDVADAYGVSNANQDFLPQAMQRLASESFMVVRASPSYGCSMVCICQDLKVLECSLSDLIDS
ncbi:hypothetical protein P3W24_11615 [Luteibacter sp. PPL201]|uniref:CheW-like domain-containing protein n=1 Tax=Luteibacter sahnii TaxID=3021977 RepID=A0ABT6BC05_9GAMM